MCYVGFLFMAEQYSGRDVSHLLTNSRHEGSVRCPCWAVPTDTSLNFAGEAYAEWMFFLLWDNYPGV